MAMETLVMVETRAASKPKLGTAVLGAIAWNQDGYEKRLIGYKSCPGA